VSTDPIGVDPWPYCDAASKQRVACGSPKVQAWSCAACGGRWWFSVVNPGQRYLELLTETVKLQVAQLALRELAS
jgi:hypothetical protein